MLVPDVRRWTRSPACGDLSDKSRKEAPAGLQL